MTNLDQKIKNLEDKEAIQRLKQYYYCHCVDRTVAGDMQAIEETISRFADDMVIDFTGLPVVEGKDEVAAFYSQQVPKLLEWCHHRVMNEVIDIDGDTATGIWYFECPGIFVEGNPFGLTGSGVVAGRYFEEFVREDGIWKWRKLVAKLDSSMVFANQFELLSN